ncbi:helix-turn-helix transcriptional regulator [Candidatus Methylospira mobilis]|uniref:Helix-turn-helix transcriptional regulator n=1 Tax=Candidatus Methylospira mobilis TaxID=1808979 RepID=A0A5Q0BGP5_9GAMM|nr:helix-turn-helix transcriptional regulator [Candidatus Methylospira mobilis]QFY42980.1 helix-turn-helix transcriptional regulator [Candidatus Methylospira mobilis]
MNDTAIPEASGPVNQGTITGVINRNHKKPQLRKAVSYHGATIKEERRELVRTFGERMRAARELCNLTQSEAARRLGYGNSSKLAKIENSSDTNSIPFLLIRRAAKVYEVSADYLLGAADDWETDARMTQERATSAWLMDAWENTRRRDLETLRKLHDKFSNMERCIVAMVAAGHDAEQAILRFSELNPTFEDEMRGGAKLITAIGDISDITRYAEEVMRRFRIECIATKQTDMFNSSWQQNLN